MAAGQIVPYPSGRVETWASLSTLVGSGDSVAEELKKKLDQYDRMNVIEAISQLGIVGELLQYAYSGAKTFNCAPQILRIMNAYQGLLTDSTVATNTFMQSSLTVYGMYDKAVQCLQRGKPGPAMKLIARSQKTSADMCVLTAKLVENATNISNVAQQALASVQDEETLTREQKRKFEELCAKLVTEQASLEAHLEGFKEEMKATDEQLGDAKKTVEQSEKRRLITSIIGAVAKPLTQLTGAVASALGSQSDGQGTDFGKLLKQTQKEREEANTLLTNKRKELAEAKAALENVNDTPDLSELHKKIAGLEVNVEELSKQDSTQEELVKKKKELAEAKANLERANETARKRKELQQKVAGLQEEVKALSEQADTLQKSIKEIESQFAEASKQAMKRLEDAEKRKFDLLEKKRKVNAELAEKVKHLEQAHTSGNTLDASIAALEMVVQTMGKVTVVFDNTRKFWMHVDAQTKSLMEATQQLEDFTEEGLEDMLLDEAKQTGMSFLALAYVNGKANQALEESRTRFSSVMSHLPTEAQAASLVRELSEKIQRHIQLALETES